MDTSKKGTAETLTYRDGVRDALSGMHGPRTKGVNDRDLPHDYLAGRDTAMGVRQMAIEPDSPENLREYWLGFVTALRREYFNDIDPSDWYDAGAADGMVALERVEAGGVIGGYTETDRGYHYTSYRVAVFVAGSDRLPDRTLGPYAEWHEAAKDRDALRAVGRKATVEGQQYDTGIGGDYPPLRVWVEIESL